MRIPLRTENRGRSMPNLLLRVFGTRSLATFDAIIDTGSTKTIISYKDAGLLQIPIKNTPTDKTIKGISSNPAKIYEYNRKLVFLMSKSDGTSFRVTKNTTLISKEKGGVNITIIGVDFLKDNNLKLVYDPNGEAYLESTSS